MPAGRGPALTAALPLHLSAEVARARDAGAPVVALETTLVTHGLPHPEGVAVAASLESEVRRRGAVPATVGILDGRACVGLSGGELARLAAHSGVTKVGLSNLAAVLAAGAPGSTTVAATAFLAWRAGIQVFATGGIGGVHRGAAESDDVSADLTALGRFPVAVVCAGAKAVLDLPRTLERLETLGVPVLGLGTDRFPAFYRRDSGLLLDRGYHDVAALAPVVRAHLASGLGTGVVVAVPIPVEHELPIETYEPALALALADAKRERVGGRAVTPFLLDRLHRLTAGASVAANRALLQHNAGCAGALASALAALAGA